MVNKTTSFKKKGKGKKVTSRRTARELPRPVSQLLGRSQRMDPSLRLSAFIAREVVTGSGTAPSTYRTRRPATPKVYVIYILLMCTLLMLAVAPGYLILVLLLIFATRNRDYGLTEDWLRTR